MEKPVKNTLNVNKLLADSNPKVIPEEKVYTAREKELDNLTDILTQEEIEKLKNIIKEKLPRIPLHLREKIQNLKDLGFENLVQIFENNSRIFDFSKENLQQKIQDLKDLGFNKPIKILTKAPSIFGYSKDNLQQKIQNLKDLGFDKPIKILIEAPNIFNLSKETLQEKIQNLKDLGFDKPVQILKNSPAIFGCSKENLQQKIQNLKDLGFEKPIKMLTTGPSVLKYDKENLQQKIQNLKDLGFENPISLIEKMPTIFSCSTETVRRKLMILQRILNIMLPNTSAVDFATANHKGFFGSNINKFFLIARVVVKLTADSSLKMGGSKKNKTNLTFGFSNLYVQSTETLANIFNYIQEGDTVTSLTQRINKISKEERLENIEKMKNTEGDDNESKLKRELARIYYKTKKQNTLEQDTQNTENEGGEK